MGQLKTGIIAACAAVLLGATFAAAQGLDTNRTTIVTFSAPVVLPGVTLPAGSYMFRLADSQTNRNIVQVFDKDRTKIYATILAIPAQRPRPADETVITFKETPANAAPAIQYWYYPGETMGQEFAYPKKQAMEIANASHTGVLSVEQENDKYDASKAGDVTRVQPSDMADTSASSSAPQSSRQSAQTNQPSSTDANASAKSTQPQQSSDMPSAKPEASQSTQPSASAAVTQSDQPSSRENQTAATSGTAATDMPAGHMAHGVGTTGTASADATTGTSGRRALPHTASSVPLLGFAGLLAIFGAASVRAFRKATV
jgi:hypothetical protein